MKTKHNPRLITKVLFVGVFLAILSYLFHPEVGQLSVTLNGQPIADPLIRFAAIPTFMVIIGIAVFLSVLLFLGIGVFMFTGTMFLALLLCLAIATYFWPVLVIIFLVIALMSFSHEKHE